MEKSIEMTIYDLSLRINLYMAAKEAESRVADLTPREMLILELIGLKKETSISKIAGLCTGVSSSTISTTITRLWRRKKLVNKTIHPRNQRVTLVSLTEEGERVLEDIKSDQLAVFKVVAASMGLSPDEVDHFKSIFENAIRYFDDKLGLDVKE
jgi:DNA-binding MarR family transcriptional regulator